MQISKVKFLGTSSRFTTGKVYDVISWTGGSGSVLDDNGAIFGTVSVPHADWQLEYLAVVELKQLYP